MGAIANPLSGLRGNRDAVRAFSLAAPLLILLLISFVLPIAGLLSRAFYEPTIARTLPMTAKSLASWSGTDIPDDAAFASFASDLKAAQSAGAVYEFAKTLNTHLPGVRSQMLRLVRGIESGNVSGKAGMIGAAPLLGELGTWRAISTGLNPVTTFYILSAFDLRITPTGWISTVDAGQAVFVRVFMRTFLIATIVTLSTLVLAFPLAFVMTRLRPSHTAIVLVLVLLPFWTSILVRTAAWTVILQKFGLLNDLLLALGLSADRLEFMYSRTGLIIAMTHIQLPFTLLPIYSAMRTLPPSQMRAAQSLGAPPFVAFRRIYVPQIMPGLMAGCLLTFILCLGYYITPALVGGASDQLISNFIANYVNGELNWEMAAALSLVLLTCTLGLYLLLTRRFGLDLFKIG